MTTVIETDYLMHVTSIMRPHIRRGHRCATVCELKRRRVAHPPPPRRAMNHRPLRNMTPEMSLLRRNMIPEMILGVDDLSHQTTDRHRKS